MDVLIVVVVLLVVGALAFHFVMKAPRFRRATLSAVPLGNYMRAREKGATAEEAIFDSIQVLRYRLPWSGLSDQDLTYAARQLATLRDPSIFTAVVVEVEETRSLAPIIDRDELERFVRGAQVAQGGPPA